MSKVEPSIIELKYGNEEKLISQRSIYKSNLYKLYLFNFCIGFFLISGILIPFYLIYGGFTFLEFMFLQSYYAIMVLLFGIPCGIIADRFSKKFALVLASFSYLLIPLIYGINSNKILFIIGETLFAFSNALVSGSNEAIVYENLRIIGKQKSIAKIVAKNDAMFLLGIIISAPLGSVLANFISIRFIVLFMFFPYLISFIITLTIHKLNFKDFKRTRKTSKLLKSGFSELKNNKVLRILVFEKIIIETIIIFLVYTYQLYLLTELNVPILYFGFIDAGLNASQFMFLNLIPHIETNVDNKRRLLLLNTIIPGIGYILIAIIDFTPLIIILFLIVIGLGLSRYIIFTNGINKQITKDNRATVLSTINVFSGILKAILYPLVGYLVLININVLYVVFGAMILFIALNSRIKKDYL